MEQKESPRSLLLDVVKSEVESRLKAALYHQVLLKLSKQPAYLQVNKPWTQEVKIKAQPIASLPTDSAIIDVFNQPEVTGRLLILGAPGSGKTTTLLELARDLLACAKKNPNAPIPVLLNLSTWKGDQQPICNWLLAELKFNYGVHIKIAERWLSNHQLLPLLDGLDELQPWQQEECVQAINHWLWQAHGPRQIVVCSRLEEYQSFRTRFLLNAAIFLHPLSYDQIHCYLKDLGCSNLWDAIKHDFGLVQMVQTPLFLNMMILAGQSLSISQWQSFKMRRDKRRYLLDAYIGQMLELQTEKKLINQFYSKDQQPSSQRTQYWLSRLAKQLQKDFQTEFWIEEMQPHWLQPGMQRWIYSNLFGLPFALMLALLLSAFVEGAMGWLTKLLLWIAFGYFFNLRDREIRSIEQVRWHWQDSVRLLLQALGYGLLTGLIMKLKGNEIDLTLLELLLVVLFSGLLIGFFGGLKSSAIQTKTIPNQGIWLSFINGGIVGLGVVLIFGLFFALISGLLNRTLAGLMLGLNIGLAVGVFPALVGGLLFGGGVCIQHLSLRLVLWANGYTPWNYGRFLNYATDRLLLQRVGGHYRFIHRLVQEHFAEMKISR